MAAAVRARWRRSSAATGSITRLDRHHLRRAGDPRTGAPAHWRRGASFLVLRDADGAQRLVELDGMDGSVLALHWDEDVSRLHARFERLDEEWTVVDDGTSHNGRWINGERVTMPIPPRPGTPSIRCPAKTAPTWSSPMRAV
jgi:hypothetical protein